MRIDRCVPFLIHFADPFGEQAVKGHGDHHAGHADVAVMHDLDAS